MTEFDLKKMRAYHASMVLSSADDADTVGELLDEIELLRGQREFLEIECSAWRRGYERFEARVKELEAEISRLSQPSACDDFGNPLVLSVSGGRTL